MYKQGNLVGTLKSVAKQICSVRHTPHHGSPLPKKELAYNRQNPKRKPPPPSPKSTSTVKKVQAVDVFDATNPTHVDIPDEFGDAFNHITDKYVNAISSTSSFDTTRPCAVCDKPGHTFDDCPVLQNVDFLHKHYIQFKLFLKKQSAATATIN